MVEEETRLPPLDIDQSQTYELWSDFALKNSWGSWSVDGEDVVTKHQVY